MSEVKAETKLAKIVHLVDPDYSGRPLEVVINRGSSNGVKAGDRFLIFGIGPHIADPDTGEDLGVLELVRGQGDVVHVQEHLSTIRSIERRRTRPARRIVRESANSASTMARAFGVIPSTSGVIEEELAPEVEVPFNSVQLGDFAKPI
jgi:hypothetical protein